MLMMEPEPSSIICGTTAREAKKTGRKLSEDECGRVYVQGLTNKSNREIALLFDKLPTPDDVESHLR